MAATYMTKALEKAPRDLNTRLAAAQWSQMINNIKQAVSQADAALQIDPKSEAAMLLRGNFALIQKDYAKAIELYNKILANSPSNFATIFKVGGTTWTTPASPKEVCWPCSSA